MKRATRIGLAGLDDRRLLDDLRALPSGPRLERFENIYDEAEQLLQRRPDVLFVGAERHGRDLPGALRLLRGLSPDLPVVIVAATEREVEYTPVAERAAAHLLLLPPGPGAVAAVLERALIASDRPAADVFLDLARGFADEINNPLLYLTGHLQLILTQAGAASGQDLHDQIQAAMDGAARIQQTVERVRLLSRAAYGPQSRQPFALGGEFQQVLQRQQHGSDAPRLVLEPPDAAFAVSGDAEVLRTALELFAQVGCELHELGCKVHFVVTELGGGVRLRLHSSGSELAAWRLPRTYEPYYLNRLLSGTSHGLSLFLVQTTVHAHRGQATARRLPDGSLVLDLQLPSG